ncbi:phosphoglycerate kinase [Candidatus Marinamargulisbacteria bacterium SCGC AG-439-L15]|nr:phosphoglycerate kinase [Candidatus Marinamargulisbacteria bacterium SCGC AG-439-L15]
MKRTIKDIQKETLKGKRVFVRADLNVPLEQGRITDDTRIREALPTIAYLIEHGAKVVLASHLGRPKGQVVDDFRLTPIQKRLSELLNKPVLKVDDCIGEAVSSHIQEMNDGDVVLLENIRFHPEEESNDESFAKGLAAFSDIYVLDAFGTAHRAHASTCGLAKELPAYAGLLVEKEVAFLAQIVENPKKPFVAIIGGAKVSTKIGVLKYLLGLVDTLVIGGGMVFTFLKARGLEIGTSLVEDDKLEEARLFLELAETSSTRVVFPQDQVVASAFDNEARTKIVGIDHLPSDMMGLDIGPKTIQELQEIISHAQMVLWNGPLGVFEMSQFAKGTFAVAEMLATSSATTIIGGGDSVSAVRQSGVSDQVSHVSTGGGATLEFLEGKELPGLEVLKNKEDV